MTPSPSSTAASAFDLDASVDSGERGEHQKQQSIRGRVQREVKEAVHQDSEASRQRSRRYAAAKLVT